MITVAREMNRPFIWYAHAAAARQAGVRADIVDATPDPSPSRGGELTIISSLQVESGLAEYTLDGLGDGENATIGHGRAGYHETRWRRVGRAHR